MKTHSTIAAVELHFLDLARAYAGMFFAAFFADVLCTIAQIQTNISEKCGTQIKRNLGQNVLTNRGRARSVISKF